jgi:hypothetical protein
MSTVVKAYLRDIRDGRTKICVDDSWSDDISEENVFYLWRDGGGYCCDCIRSAELMYPDEPEKQLGCCEMGRNVIVLDRLEVNGVDILPMFHASYDEVNR